MLNKRKKYADGKIIVTNFKKVKPSTFYPIYTYTKEELINQLMLCTADGRWFINDRIPGYDFILSVMELLVLESRYTLENYRQTYKGQFKEVTFENWKDMNTDNAKKIIALTLLLIPGEIKRRELERAYYIKQKIVKIR